MSQTYELLIAEDNPADLYLLEESLREHNVPCHIHSAENAEQLMSYAEEACEDGPPPSPDLIILDWMLPRAEPTRIIRHLRGTKRCSETPIVVLSSLISPIDRESASAAGATLVLNKPTQLDEFMQIGGVLKKFLESNSGVSSSSAKR